jgi:hypothetical protein
MRDESRKALDRVESDLPVGRGKLDLTAYLHGSGGVGSFGGAVDYEHRVATRVAAFGTAWLGGAYDPAGIHTDYGALAGLRFRF